MSLRPEDRARMQRGMRERAAREAEHRVGTQEPNDRLGFRDALQRALRPHDRDLDAVVGLPDAEARQWLVVELPPESTYSGTMYQRNVGPAPRNHVLVAPGETPPENAISTRTVAELRSDYLVQQQRVRRISERNRMAGIPVGRTGGQNR